MKALAKIDRLDPSSGCRPALERGVQYVTDLFDANGLPKPFAKPPTFVRNRQLVVRIHRQ